VQAKEYYDAAHSVSLATKPVLLYYCTMSLALAEILFKQDGGSSLDKARGENAHHGLTFQINSTARKNQSFINVTNSLRAIPMSISGKRSGTFELWHSSSREYPILGELQIANTGDYASNLSYAAILKADDIMLPKMPIRGLSLLDCVQRLPVMFSYLQHQEAQSLLVRGSVSASVYDGISTVRLIIHPSKKEVLEGFYNEFRVHPSELEALKIFEMQNGVMLDFVTYPNLQPQQKARYSIPISSCISKREVFFSSERGCLNEFGLFYVSIYIAGNYARYYPDKWLVDVDKANANALLIEELLYQSESRLPLLALSELSRNYLVPV